MADFAHVSWQQAVAYRDHVRAREPYRLRDLARWMAATGGPLQAADASVASLVPVWGWFVGFVLDDCPGLDPRLRGPFVTAQANPGGWPGDRGEPISATGRAQAAAIGLEHYLRLVLQRHDPPAPWEIYLTPPRARTLDHSHHSTGVRTGSGAVWVIDPIYTLAANIVDDRVHARRPEALLEWLVRAAKWSQAPAQPPAASVLAPLLTADLPPEPEQAALSPVWSWPSDYWKDTSGGSHQTRVGEEMTLWHGPAAGLDDAPQLLAPLPVEDVARVLAAHGFVGEHGPADAAALLSAPGEDGLVELAHRAEAGQVLLQVSDGALRSLHLEPWAFTTAEWTSLTRDLRTLARRTGARFLADDRIDD